MTAWGMKNAHLEPWDFGRAGWLNESATGAIIAPVRENVKFIRDHASHPINFCRAEPYFGTQLHTQLAKEQDLGGSRPVVRVNAAFEVREGRGVHGDFRMPPRSAKLRAFRAESAIAEGCTFRGDANNADVHRSKRTADSGWQTGASDE